MDKKEQEKLLTEIMEADAKDGLYEPSEEGASEGQQGSRCWW